MIINYALPLDNTQTLKFKTEKTIYHYIFVWSRLITMAINKTWKPKQIYQSQIAAMNFNTYMYMYWSQWLFLDEQQIKSNWKYII